MKRGVLYHFSGLGYTMALVCSLQQLRKFYGGPICLAATQECAEVANRIASDPRTACYVTPTEVVTRTVNRQWMSKATTFYRTPFQRTLFMDADTIVRQDCLADLFDGDQVVLTRLNDSTLNDGGHWSQYFQGRMAFFENFGPQLAKEYREALARNPPIINTGVMAFSKSDPLMVRAIDLMLAVRTAKTASDETVIQLLAATYPVRVVTSRYNWIARRDAEEAVWIRHFTRRNWRLRDAADYRKYIDEALDANYGNVRDWLPNCWTEDTTF